MTLIATMPEMLTLSINVGGHGVGNNGYFAPASTATDGPEIATGITTGWSLLPGRAKIAIWAILDHLNAPVLVARAMPIEAGLSLDRSFQPRSSYGFAARPNISSTQIAVIGLTQGSRRGTSTAILSHSIDAMRAPQFLPNTSPETLKIQVQAVL